jgi:hypothetical protein
LSRGGAAALPASVRAALAEALADEPDVVRVLLRRGADGRPNVLIELAEIAPDLEDYKARIQELVQLAARGLGRHATKVGFSIGDRAALSSVATGATVVDDREAP